MRNGGENHNKYGSSSTFDMGAFEEDMYSDYIIFLDTDFPL